MFGKVLKLAGVFLVASTLLVKAGPVFAAEAPGAGPELAFTVPAGTFSIPGGGELWFAFNYAGDGSQINVDMNGNFLWPGHGRPATQFTVWTPLNVQARSMNQAVTPTGASAVNSYTGKPDQVWTGNFNWRGTYYVVVDQNAPTPNIIQLTVTGSGVSSAGQPMASSAAAETSAGAAAGAGMPAPAGPAVSATVSSTVAVSATVPITLTAPATVSGTVTASAAVSSTISASGTVSSTATAAGTGPINAIASAQGWVTIIPGNTTWYAFQYPGGSSAGPGPRVTIDMFTYPSTAAGYTVWTPQNVQAMLAGQSVTPVGIGSLNPNKANDILWSGSFIQPGTYYVVVNQIQPGGYDLQITGHGLTF